MGIDIKEYLDGDRLLHTIGVQKKMSWMCDKNKVSVEAKLKLLELAKIHDIGYSEKVIDTGFHPYDGYKFTVGKVDDIISLGVLLHTNSSQLAVYGDARVKSFYKIFGRRVLLTESQFYIDAITYCDVTTDSKGRQVSTKQRFESIRYRYGDRDLRTEVFKYNLGYYNELVKRFE